MYGWIQDCIEALVIDKFGHEAWSNIKEKAGVQEAVGTFVRHKYYEDKVTYDLVGAACDALGLSAADILREFGKFFLVFVMRAGYSGLLAAQGSTLTEFLQNMNCMHHHLQGTLPSLVPPSFAAEDLGDGRILLEYWSHREGLAPLVEGVVTESAKQLFNLEVTVEPYEVGRLSVDGTERTYVRFLLRTRSAAGDGQIDRTDRDSGTDFQLDPMWDPPPLPKREVSVACCWNRHRNTTPTLRESACQEQLVPRMESHSFLQDDFRKLLPFHVALDSDMNILHIGVKFAQESGLGVGAKVATGATIISPPGVRFTKESLMRAQNSFIRIRVLKKPGLVLIGGVSEVPRGFIFLGSVDAATLDSLKAIGYSLASFPVHDATRKVVLLGEQLAAELGSATHMEQVNIALSTQKSETIRDELQSDLKHFLAVSACIHTLKACFDVYDFYTDVLAFLELKARSSTSLEEFVLPFLILLLVDATGLAIVLPHRVMWIARFVRTIIAGQVKLFASKFGVVEDELRHLNDLVTRLGEQEKSVMLGCVSLIFSTTPMCGIQISVMKAQGQIEVDSSLSISVMSTLLSMGIQLGLMLALLTFRSTRRRINAILAQKAVSQTTFMQKYRGVPAQGQ